MILRTAILSAVEAAIEADGAFAGVACIQDDGAQEDNVAAQLRTVGTVVTLDPVAKFTPRDQAAGAMIGDVTFTARLMVNPDVNSKLDTPRVFDSMRASVVSVLLSMAVDDHGERFRLVDDSLADFDPGLLAAEITFEKGCQVNPL